MQDWLRIAKPKNVLRSACIQEIKAKQSLYYTYAQVSFGSKVDFLSELKTRCADLPHTSSKAFLVHFSDILQLKKH